MSDELKTVCMIFALMLVSFCGLALCIHVYGMHWANHPVPIQAEKADEK